MGKTLSRQTKSQRWHFAPALSQEATGDTHLRNRRVNEERQSLGLNRKVNPGTAQNEGQDDSHRAGPQRPGVMAGSGRGSPRRKGMRDCLWSTWRGAYDCASCDTDRRLER